MKDLVELLNLEELDIDLYRGSIAKEALRRVFGGQVVGQALMAACNTVDKDRLPHSLHAYFMRPGNPDKPIIFEVYRDRDGASFTSRRVVAKQSGVPILNLACSFQRAEKGYDHQVQMPKFSPPSESESHEDWVKANLEIYPDNMRPFLLKNRAVEFRQIFSENPNSLEQNYWFRLVDDIGDNQILQRVMFAYATDFTLLGACLLPHRVNWLNDDVQAASLDHALWFHDDVKFDEWHLYHQTSPWAGAGRGLNRGEIYNTNGKLIASVAQEGLIRPRKRK